MKYTKAIASGIVGLVGFLLLKRGITLDPELEGVLLALVSGLIVWAVPNRPA